jgi:hypothetical protein
MKAGIRAAWTEAKHVPVAYMVRNLNAAIAECSLRSEAIEFAASQLGKSFGGILLHRTCRHRQGI